MTGPLDAKLIMEHLVQGLFVIFTIFAANEASDWSYEGDLGPKYWHKMFPDGCSGRQQSPIDIVTNAAHYNPKLNDFAIWHDPPKPGSQFKVVNNGHSITVHTNGPFKITNGGLPSIYSTAQFHFHWGHANHQGSEHLIDHRASPLEMHIVNWDSETYQSLPMAMVEPMGLAVLGIMYEIGEKDNEALEPIIQALKHVEDPENDVEEVIEAQSLRNFLPEDTSKYYRYNGSLTTPGCFESIVWTVFDEPQYISHRQMMAFRRVLQKKQHKKDKKHHKRSATKEEKTVREVMEEAGIDDTLQKMELEMALEEKKDKEESLGEPPKKFHLHHGENPEAKNLKHVNQSGEIHYTETGSEKRLEELVIDLEHKNEELIEEIKRLKLVNNFRPVQPLYGRVVYRSFPAVGTIGEDNKMSQNVEPCNSGNNIVISWSILLLSALIALYR